MASDWDCRSVATWPKRWADRWRWRACSERAAHSRSHSSWEHRGRSSTTAFGGACPAIVGAVLKYTSSLPALLCLAALGAGVRAEAQRPGPTFVCNGEVVSRVEIQPSPPPFAGAARKWQAA